MEAPPVIQPPPAPPRLQRKPSRRRRGLLALGFCLCAIVACVLLLRPRPKPNAPAAPAPFVLTDLFDTQPMAVAQVPPSPATVAALDQRVSRFLRSLEHGGQATPLTLGSDDLNAWVAGVWEGDSPSNQIVVAIAGETVTTKFSVGLDSLQIPLLGLNLAGRYLNATAHLHIGLTNGVLWANLESLEARGHQLPAEFLPLLRSRNLAAEFSADPDNAAGLRCLQSVEVRGGQLILTPKPNR